MLGVGDGRGGGACGVWQAWVVRADQVALAGVGAGGTGVVGGMCVGADMGRTLKGLRAT
jgi:hypothetical protein